MDNDKKQMSIEGKSVVFAYPSVGQTKIGDMEYSKAFTQAIKNGIMPKFVIEKTLVESGLWTEEDINAQDALDKKLEEVVLKIHAEKDKNKKEELKNEFYFIQSEIINLGMKRQSLATHSAESKGEEAKLAYLISQCVLNEDGSKLWNSEEDFLNSTNNSFIAMLVQEFVSFTSGLDKRIDSIEQALNGPQETEETIQDEEIVEDAVLQKKSAKTPKKVGKEVASKS